MLSREFELLPAIDVLEGRVVRLHQGRRERVTIEGGDPVELARRFAAEGADRLHLVDLDGAFAGAPTLDLVRRIAEAGGLPVQVGGGYRTLEAISAALDAGADRVMVGTAALEPGFLERAVAAVGGGLVVAVDARSGRVAADGWTRLSELTPVELVRRCAAVGVERLLVTSAARDGSLAGPDLELLASVVPFGIPILAAGGVSSVEDVLALRRAGCAGAVCGSALLAERFTLAEARRALERPHPSPA